MYFLIQIKKLADGTYTKGTSSYATKTEALIQLYVAMSSAMSKGETASVMCMICDEHGTIENREYWEVSAETED